MGISTLTGELTEVVESETQRTDMGKQDDQRIARLPASQIAEGRLKEPAGLLATQAHQLRLAGGENPMARRHATRAADLLRATERQPQRAKMEIEILRGQLQFQVNADRAGYEVVASGQRHAGLRPARSRPFSVRKNAPWEARTPDLEVNSLTL